MSREQWSQPETATQLAQSVARAVTRRANRAFIDQVAPTPPALGPSTGLLHVTGIVDGGEVAVSLDALIDLVAELQTNLSTPSHILLSAYGAVNVNTSEHKYFDSDSVAIRCTFRLGQNAVRPNRIGKFTIGGTGS
jgi:hypothetical protein